MRAMFEGVMIMWLWCEDKLQVIRGQVRWGGMVVGGLGKPGDKDGE